MAYSQLPDRTSADTNAAIDVNTLQDNIEALKGGTGATAPTTTIENLSSDKADKVTSPTTGNLAGLDANGNITDSGIAPSPSDKADASDVLKKDGSVSLTSDWDIGDGRAIKADKIEARDGAGLALYDDGGNGVFIEDGGNVGVGTTSPTENISISETTPLTAGTLAVRGVGDAGVYSKITLGKTSSIQHWLISYRLDEPEALRFAYKPASGGHREYIFNISSDGKVGIGTTTPARSLHVSDTMRLEPRSSAPSSPSAGDIYFDSTSSKLKCYDGSTWQNCF